MSGKEKGIVDKMMREDFFSQWLGIKVVDASEGSCLLQMTVRKEMLNGFGIAHGGIAYSLADSALAFAANGHGKVSLSIETSIAHFNKIVEGETILAEAVEIHKSNKIAKYSVEIFSLKGEKKALFTGTVYRSQRNH